MTPPERENGASDQAASGSYEGGFLRKPGYYGSSPEPGDAFGECYDVLQHVGGVGWTIGVGPDHSKTGERPWYVRIELGDGSCPVDLSPADAAALAGDLAQRAAELLS
jgi:hypothetical protein